MIKWGSYQEALSGGQRDYRHSSNVNEEEDEEKLTISKLSRAACIDKNGKHGFRYSGRIHGRPSGSVEGDSDAQIVSTVTEVDGEQRVMITEAPNPMNRGRKRVTRGPVSEKVGKRAEPGETQQNCNKINRWPAERYKSAEQNMLEIMKAKGAVFEKPISRHVLRTAARKKIGDTGLLDHLLKYIDNKVAPGGGERFRRCYSREGVMLYWLESVDMVEIKREAGVHDPDWVSPIWWKSDIVIQEPGELNLLKQEMSKMSNVHKFMCKQEVPDQSNALEKMHKEFVGWRTNIDQQIAEISNTLTSTQGMYKELMSWKDKTEQQLLAICNSFNSVQASNTCSSFNPTPDRWEEWLDGIKFDNMQGGDLATWFGNTNFTDVLGEAVVGQEPFSAVFPLPKPVMNEPSQDRIPVAELKLVNDEITSTERRSDGVMQELLLLRRSAGDQTNMTPDSSLTANAKSDIDNSAAPNQEILEEMLNWKAKVEQQLMEISSAIVLLQTRK